MMKPSKAAGLVGYAITRSIADVAAWAKKSPIAGAFLTVRSSDGAQIDAFNADTPLEIASLTKLRTATAFRHSKVSPDGHVELVSEDFVSSSPSFQQGDIVSVDALVSSMMLYSDNVAAQALSRLVGGDFIGKMNSEGRGMFTDSWGGGTASAYDVVNMIRDYEGDNYLLQRALDQHYKVDVSGHHPRKVQWSNRVLGRSNIPGFIWGKTGTSDYRASLAFSWEKEGERFISVVLRSRGDRFRDGKILVARAIERLKA